MVHINFDNKEIPDYYDTMYLDGFSPEEIMYACHKTLTKKIEAWQKGEEAPNDIKILTEIKLK